MALPLETLRQLVKLATLRTRILDRDFEKLETHVRGGASLSRDQWEALDLAWDLRRLCVFSGDEYAEQVDAQIVGIVGSAPSVSRNTRQKSLPHPPRTKKGASERLPGTTYEAGHDDDGREEAVEGAASRPVDLERERQAREKQGNVNVPAPTPDDSPVPPVAPLAEPAAPASEPAPTGDSDRGDDACPSAGDIPGINPTDGSASCAADRGQCGDAGCSKVGPVTDTALEDGEACPETSEASCYLGEAPAPTPAAPAAPVAAPVVEPFAAVTEPTAGVAEPIAPTSNSGDDVCASAGDIPVIESTDSKACGVAECGQRGGTGRSTAAPASDDCAADGAQQCEEACPDISAASCDLGDAPAPTPAPTPDAAPGPPVSATAPVTAPVAEPSDSVVKPIATMAKPTVPLSEPAPIGVSSDDSSCHGGDIGDGDGDDDVSTSAGDSPGIESSNDQCGGDGCPSVAKDTDCYIADIMEDGEAYSTKGSAPCCTDRAPAPDELPVTPSATVAETAAPVSKPVATVNSSDDSSCHGGDVGDGDDDLCATAVGSPGIESSNDQCGGDGCFSIAKDKDCCIADIMEDGEACSTKESAPCYTDRGNVPAPAPVEAPVTPAATVAEPASSVSEPAPTGDSSDCSSCHGGDVGDGDDDVSTSAGDSPGIESSNDQCGGDGCPSVAKDTDCYIADIMEDGEAYSTKGSAPCYTDRGNVPAPAPDEAPVAPAATVAEAASPEPEPAPTGDSSDDNRDDGSDDSRGDGSDVDDGGDDACASGGSIPGIESSDGQACCRASCGQCGGYGCSSAVRDKDCCISDDAEDREACSTKGSAPCYTDDGGVPAPTPTGDIPDSLDQGDNGYDEEMEQLLRLRQQHKLDRDGAIQAFSESDSKASFLAAAAQCTTAIESFEKLMEHIEECGDEQGNRGTAADGIQRSRLSPLLWRRGAAHVKAGRNLSAVKDFETAIELGCKFKERNFLRMGGALLRAGDLSKAKKMFQNGTKVQNSAQHNTEFAQHNRECSQGFANATAVELHVEAGSAALLRFLAKDAIRSANQALALSPNHEKAQELLILTLWQGKRWTEARLKCEVWAYKLEACNWAMGGNQELAGFETGGGPPRVCARMMYGSLRRLYCLALRYDGLEDDFLGVLEEAIARGEGWAQGVQRGRLVAMDKKKLADQAYKSGSFDEAVDLYTEAIFADPGHHQGIAVLYGNRAAALMNLGRDQEALEDCEEALRRKPDYPKVLERRARLLDDRVDQEGAQGAKPEPEPEETSQGSQHDQPQPQERVTAQGWMRRDQAGWYSDQGRERRASEAEVEAGERRQEAAEEEDREINANRARVQEELRQRAELDERVEEVRRNNRGHQERSREADDLDEERKNVWLKWWEGEKQRMEDEIEREQDEREVEYQRTQLKKREEAVMRLRLAAQRREAAAQEAQRIMRRQEKKREDDQVRRVAAERRAERERRAEEELKEEQQAKKAAEDEEERRRVEQETREEEERKVQEARKERERKRKEKKDKKAEPRRRAAAAKKAEEERKAQEQKKEAEMRQKAIEDEKEKRRVERWKREEEEARVEEARRADEARVAEEKRKAAEKAKAEVRKREEKMRREAKKMKQEKQRWEEIQRRAAQREKEKATRREEWEKRQEQERRAAAERRRVEEEWRRAAWRRQQEQARRAAEEERYRREEERMHHERTMGRHYDTLGIASNSTLEQVKKAYRQLALKTHPDKNQQSKAAEAMFREIHEAYEVLVEYHDGEDHDGEG